MASFFSDKLASPRGASCPLFSSGSHSFLSAACFALPLARLAGSSGLAVRFRMTFASPSPFSSSTSSLRIAWEIEANEQEHEGKAAEPHQTLPVTEELEWITGHFPTCPYRCGARRVWHERRTAGRSNALQFTVDSCHTITDSLLK